MKIVQFPLCYILANANTWKGETARRIKKELNAMIKARRIKKELNAMIKARRIKKELNAMIKAHRAAR
jgi:hypothetical protein